MEAAFSGEFLNDEIIIAERLAHIKMWLFDWDGVFHPGTKNDRGESSFNEIDAMGLNLLRFSSYLNLEHTLPAFAIVTGVNNPTGAYFAQREHFDAIYMGAKDKTVVLDYICSKHNLTPDQIGFCFDDVLDINVAEKVGVRFLISHGSNPITRDFMRSKSCFDYATAFGGGFGALREVSELCMTLMGNADDVLEHRTSFDDTYNTYWNSRQKTDTKVFTVDLSGVHPHEQESRHQK